MQPGPWPGRRCPPSTSGARQALSSLCSTSAAQQRSKEQESCCAQRCCRAAGLGSSGRVFLGANLEFAGLPLNFSIHAEQFLLVNMLRAGERQLVQLMVSAAPCGHCRQFLAELHRVVCEICLLSCSCNGCKATD